MEVRRLGDSLLKLRPSTSFLRLHTTSLSPPRLLVEDTHSSNSASCSLTHSRRNAFATYRPASAGSTAAADPSSTAQTQPSEVPSVDPLPTFHGSQIGDLLGKVGIPGVRRNTAPSLPAAQGSRNPQPISSFDAIRTAFQDNPSASAWQALQPGSIYSQMEIPGQSSGAAVDGSESSRSTAPKKTSLKPRAVRTIQSSPSVGRTVEVVPERGMDLPRALRKLEIRIALNGVRKDQMKQRFHERPGMKRKRLRSERWRARFKRGFKAMVQKVQAMRNKGW